jgi:hypothetical protein
MQTFTCRVCGYLRACVYISVFIQDSYYSTHAYAFDALCTYCICAFYITADGVNAAKMEHARVGAAAVGLIIDCAP